ncbi:MAG: hypothetical protein QNI87_00250 [Erythrobacter sp.]|uniref:hypothetical protein n=1 Tax=Erythrobacter sp. TaxID=1042 RepID=UPI002637DC0A|nr:hypothetical protein [Erythrobacter sp.]MDJ0976946.1 hypothetical protein [Erythrobacter sp.]
MHRLKSFATALRLVFGLVFGLVTLHFMTGPAIAAWYEASSEHFVIYADDSPKDLKRYAENLERYHSAMEYVTGHKTEEITPSNRVVIFVAGSRRDIRKLAGTGDRYISGFYIPRAAASRAFVQNIRNSNGYPHISTIVLLHEYTHHFMMSQERFAFPLWLNEGAAEFFAAATFKRDGTVLIGRPAQHRGAELLYANDVSLEELFDQELYEKNRGRGYDAFYGRSWLLYHYLTFEPERAGQLADYGRAIVRGQSSLDAARDVFGDLGQLERELAAYQRQRRMFTFALPPEKLNASPVSMRKLPEGEAKMMPLRMRSQRGVTSEQAVELLAEVRAVAAQYPDDAGVQTALAEAEYDAGNDAQAIAAADRAIALDPTRANAYVQKGFALFRMAREAEDEEQDAAYDRAMKPFARLNRVEVNHPLPLLYYYRSFTERGLDPPEKARLALERAAQLAPFDQSLWFEVAMLQLREGKIALARNSLQPIAYNPHGGAMKVRAQNLVEQLAELPEGAALSSQTLAMIAGSSDLRATLVNDSDEEDPSDPEDGAAAPVEGDMDQDEAD